jgi:hypothetical protein
MGLHEPRYNANHRQNAFETQLIYDLRFAIRVYGKHSF